MCWTGFFFNGKQCHDELALCISIKGEVGWKEGGNYMHWQVKEVKSEIVALHFVDLDPFKKGHELLFYEVHVLQQYESFHRGNLKLMAELMLIFYF